MESLKTVKKSFCFSTVMSPLLQSLHLFPICKKVFFNLVYLDLFSLVKNFVREQENMVVSFRGTKSYHWNILRELSISLLLICRWQKRRLNPIKLWDQGNIRHVQPECLQECVWPTMVLLVSPRQLSWKRSKRLCTTD